MNSFLRHWILHSKSEYRSNFFSIGHMELIRGAFDRWDRTLSEYRNFHRQHLRNFYHSTHKVVRIWNFQLFWDEKSEKKNFWLQIEPESRLFEIWSWFEVRSKALMIFCQMEEISEVLPVENSTSTHKPKNYGVFFFCCFLRMSQNRGPIFFDRVIRSWFNVRCILWCLEMLWSTYNAVIGRMLVDMDQIKRKIYIFQLRKSIFGMCNSNCVESISASMRPMTAL